MSTTWWEYVVNASGTTVQKEMAAATGISETAFSRWKKGTNKAEAPMVITFARAYRKSPVEALVAAGILAANDIVEGVVEIQADPSTLDDDALLAEIRKRMRKPADNVVRRADWGKADPPRGGESSTRAASKRGPKDRPPK